MNPRIRRFPASYVLSRLLRLLLPALLVALSAQLAQAQDVTLREGSRVSIETRSRQRTVGIVKSFDMDSVRLFTGESGATLSVARSDVTEIQVSHGRSAARGAIRGAMWGAGVMGVLGAIFVAAVESDDTYTVTDSDRAVFLANSIVGGALWGAGIGAFVKSERWERISMRPRITSSSAGVGLGVRVQSTLLH